MRTLALCGLLACTFFAVSGCGPSGSPSGEVTGHTYSGTGPIHAVCTTGMVADLVRHVAGERLKVVQLMGEGVDPHVYKASPGDVSQLGQADLIFYSGLHLEGQMADIFVRMARVKPTYAVTEGVDPARLLQVEEGYYDPHLWFDVALWSETLEVVVTALAEFDPAHAEQYRLNADAYRQELAKLHEECRAKIASIPESQRVVVTAHDAFHYFGRAYGIEVRAIQGVSTESEAGLKEINDLVEFLTSRKINAVFVETSVSDRNVRSLVEGCAQRGHAVTVGGELYSDAMGPPGTPEGTYVGMIRHNVESITAALQ